MSLVDLTTPLTSMSLSRFRNCSMAERALMPPQQWLERSSTGLVTLGTAGNRRRKSSSAGSICLLISRTCKTVRSELGLTWIDRGIKTLTRYLIGWVATQYQRILDESVLYLGESVGRAKYKTSPMSSDIPIHCISYTLPMILNGLFTKPSHTTGYWMVCQIGNTTYK